MTIDELRAAPAGTRILVGGGSYKGSWLKVEWTTHQVLEHAWVWLDGPAAGRLLHYSWLVSDLHPVERLGPQL